MTIKAVCFLLVNDFGIIFCALVQHFCSSTINFNLVRYFYIVILLNGFRVPALCFEMIDDLIFAGVRRSERKAVDDHRKTEPIQ